MTTTEKARLKALADKKRAGRQASNQVRLTLEIAESRKDFADRWEELRAYAGKVSADYCFKRGVYGHEEIRDEALSESWRLVCNGETPERAIVKAVDLLTQTRKNQKAYSQSLPDMPEHSSEYEESAADLAQLIAALPEKLRAYALAMSAGLESCEETWGMLGISQPTASRYHREIKRRLGSRFGYLLMDELDIMPAHRLAD